MKDVSTDVLSKVMEIAMESNLNDRVKAYKKALQNEDIQIAYKEIIRVVSALRARFSHVNGIAVGNVSPGYLDYTYFPFFNESLRRKKVRYGIVLNHKDMRFELWLMGQNEKVQSEYWNLLKDTEWNKSVEVMPRYSVLEVVLVEDPDFDDITALSDQIESEALELVSNISPYLL